MKVAVLAVTALLAAGCMSSSKSVGGTTTTPTTTAAATTTSGPPQTFLTLVIWPRGKKYLPKVFRLSCLGGATAPGPSRPVPHRAAACRRILRLGAKGFAPVARNVACTQIYGGPQIAEVVGLLKGQLLKATFTRTDGCEIARWDRFKFLLPIKT
jgi:hypothetical protein